MIIFVIRLAKRVSLCRERGHSEACGPPPVRHSCSADSRGPHGRFPPQKVPIVKSESSPQLERTHSVPIGLALMHRKGVAARVSASDRFAADRLIQLIVDSFSLHLIYFSGAQSRSLRSGRESVYCLPFTVGFSRRGFLFYCPAERAEIWLDSLALAAAGHIATPAVAKVPVLIVHELEVREGEFFLN